ncbi:MAG: AtpZ/AtpI family protein [Acidimicrobiia bacterium]
MNQTSQPPDGVPPPVPRDKGGARVGEMSKGMSQASEGLSVAFAFVAAVILLWLGGRALDNWLGTDPWFQIVGTIAGWVSGTLIVLTYARHMTGKGAKRK